MMSVDDPITRRLRDVYEQVCNLDDGDLATYIPQLAKADPSLTGISLVSLGGRVYDVGNTDTQFTLQSVSKPFVYAMALEESGIEHVLERVGVEPSGEKFNAISLEPVTGRPANAMINAGAILTTSLIQAANAAERFERIRSMLSRFAGRDLEVDMSVYRSESQTGDRNRALGYLMRGAGALTGEVEDIVDVYFRQCSILATPIDIAIMGATLANGGKNPLTGVTVINREVANYVLSVMATCGMYDASGSWFVRIGLPAKSGVSGGIVAVSPGEFGIGLFSPLLDSYGNSVRGIAACKLLASQFELQLLARSTSSYPSVYATSLQDFSYGWVGAKHLEETGGRLPDSIIVRGLQGDLAFAEAEIVLRSFDHLLKDDGNVPSTTIVLDVHRVRRVSRAGSAILNALARDLEAAGHTVHVVDRQQRTVIAGAEVFPSLESAIRGASDGNT